MDDYLLAHLKVDPRRAVTRRRSEWGSQFRTLVPILTAHKHFDVNDNHHACAGGTQIFLHSRLLRQKMSSNASNAYLCGLPYVAAKQGSKPLDPKVVS
jgi:hypothetical protein